MVEPKMSKEGLANKLEMVIAGETLDWHQFERYIKLARPKTLSTLMKATKAEAYMEAIQDKVLSPRQKIAIMTIALIALMGIIGLYIVANMGLLG